MSNKMLVWILVYFIIHYCHGLGWPKLGPLSSIPTCKECIVFKTGETLTKVFCDTEGASQAANVTFQIGSFEFSSTRRSPKSFRINSTQKPLKDVHSLNIVCTVSGKYRNISVKAPIYIVEFPEGPPNLSASVVLLEGESVDITCKSSKARPPPLLKLFVEEDEIETIISTAFDNKTGLFISISKLDYFKKEWGNKKMWCQQLPDVDKLYYQTDMSNYVYVEYNYPPSQLNLHVIDQGNQSSEMAVHCIAIDSNPICDITWESSIENFKYTIHPNVLKHISHSTITFNVTDADFGKKIRCRTECPDFEYTLSNSTTVIFAKKPRVVINSSSDLPVPPTSNVTLTCASNAFPYGKITWQLLKASNSFSSHEQLCLDVPTCTYEMKTTDVEQECSCTAENEHGTDRRTITVTVQETNKHNEELTGKDFVTLDVLFLILAAGIAFLLIGIGVIMLLRRRKHAKLQLTRVDIQTEMNLPPSPTAADNDEVKHAHMDGAEYAVINKTQRKPGNVALPCSKDLTACETKNECLDNAVTESSVHVEQQLIEHGDSAQESDPLTQHDVLTAGDKNDVTHARMDGAEYAVIDKTHRDPKLAALPSSKDISSCKGDNERLDNAATESSVNVEQPSIENGIRALEPGPSRQPNVSGCQSREVINTTEKVKDIGVSKQKQITNPDAPNANNPKRATTELVYADVDIEHLEKSRAGNRACNNDERTEYSDISFGTACGEKPDTSNENVYNN